MLRDYTNRTVQGSLFFPKFNEGAFLRVGLGGILEYIDLPFFKYAEFEQTFPSSSWNFEHNFGIAPFVMALDQNGVDITQAVSISKDDNTVQLNTEAVPITGKLIVYSLGFSLEDNVETESFAVSPRWYLAQESTQLAINAGYTVVEGSEDRIGLTLPINSVPGNFIQIIGETPWRIAQNAGQTIRFGNQVSLEGINGYIESTQIGDCVTLTCSHPDHIWVVTSSQGILNII